MGIERAKQYRAVYEYRKGLIRGAGACFVIAQSEDEARWAIEKAMPGVSITQIREEQTDPLAAYERQDVPPVLSVVRAENLPAAALEEAVEITCAHCGHVTLAHAGENFRCVCGRTIDGRNLVSKPVECIGCDEPTCEKCVKEKAAKAARADSNAFADRWS